MPKIPKLVSGAVLSMVAVAAMVTFTRGDSPRADAATLASLPGASGTDGPTVRESAKSPGSTSTLDEPENEDDKGDKSKPSEDPTAAGATAAPTQRPTTAAPTATTPAKTEEPPPPAPKPAPPSGGLGGLLEALLGGGN